jgi:hypothetical protein
MYDYETELNSKISFYNDPALIDNPHHPAGFKGTFKFSEHRLIPDVYQGFLQRHFGVMRLSRIKIEEINKLMNEVWEGPGSLEKIFRLEEEYRAANRPMQITPADYVKIKKVTKDEDEDDESEKDLPLPTFGEEEIDEE